MGAIDGFLAPLADAYEEAWDAFREAIRPTANLTLSEWSETHRILPAKGSSEPGPWRNSRTPYLVEIMDCLSAGNPAEVVVVMKGTQVGGTECGNNWMGYIIHHDPAPMMAIQPTLNLAKRFSKQRIAPMIEAMPILRELVAEKRSRDSANTTLMKDFPGGLAVLAGANSAADLRSMPVKYIFADEIDAYPHDVDGEGDPLELARKRRSNFPRGKELLTSTPTTKKFSKIEREIERTDLRRYHLPCPHCHEHQYLKWSNLRWRQDPEHRPETAHYVCEHCGAEIEEHHKTWMLERGRWIADFPGRGAGKLVGFHLPTMYSPLGWASWGSLVEQFVAAKVALDAGDDTKMKTFVNTVLAETWEEQGDTVKPGGLQARAAASDYVMRQVPIGALVLTMGVDVQGNRLEFKIKAWGRFEESWLIEYGAVYGDPTKTGAGSVWDQLKTKITTPLRQDGGSDLRVRAVAVDSGGHHTHEVYAFCRANRHLQTFAVKGHSLAGRPVLGKPSDQDVNFRGQKIKRGASLWMVGSDTAKSLIYGRLKVQEPGPGYMHFPRDVGGEYFEQLTAERLVTKYVKGRPRLEWLKPAGKRNEGLDLEVYAYAAACYLGLHRYKALDWERLERQVQPNQMDLLATTVAQGGHPDKASVTAAPAESVETGPDQKQVAKSETATSGRAPVARPADSWIPRRKGWLR